MAILIPERNVIEQQKVSPTSGEMALINFLEATLDDEYEVYYQPFLNGKNPDVVLMRKGGGVLIIEVKDWSLANYDIDDGGNWRLRKNHSYVTSPFLQVELYKKKLQDMNYRFLYETFQTKKVYGTIKTAVYFHCESRNNVLKFIEKNNISEHIHIIGRDSLNSLFFNKLLYSTYIGRASKYFNNELYKSIKRYLKPTFHQLEIGQEVAYTREQEILIKSEKGKRQKIKGTAGSGKTLVLAKRAVNAHLRTQKRVLILTFNISLVNYIHDQISRVRENFAWKNFYITNYHSFFRESAKQYGLQINDRRDYNDKNFFSSRRESIKKFDAIFIDEIQDYKQEWLYLIVSCFSTPDTEMVVFGDEKQNIYDRELDENKEIVVHGIVGQWNRSLKKSFRLRHDIGCLAIDFQKKFLDGKYRLDEMLIAQSVFDFEPSVIECHEISNLEEINDMIFDFIDKHNIHSNDVAILGDGIKTLRELDFRIRSKYQEDTMTTFEMQEEYKEMEKKGLLEESNLNQIRKAKKLGFWLNAGMIKLSTVHSFKGWEIHTVFLLIDEASTPELVYTGITRARQNIVIVNLGNTEFADFFRKNTKRRGGC